MSGDPLLERALAGDRAALGGLLEQHASKLRRALEGTIPAKWQAVLSVDDVMQDTYVDVFLDITRFEPVGEDAFGRWLLTIARRNLLDAVKALETSKRGGRQTRIAGEATTSLARLYDTLTSPSRSPSRVAAAKEAQAELRRAIDQLPEIYRRVIECYDLEGRPIEAVARELERSPGAVYLVRNRAHRRLRELLGPKTSS